MKDKDDDDTIIRVDLGAYVETFHGKWEEDREDPVPVAA